MGNQLSLSTFQSGKFFGHEFFLESYYNHNNNTSDNGAASPPRDRMGMRALKDCSMYLLSENNMMYLVRA